MRPYKYIALLFIALMLISCTKKKEKPLETVQVTKGNILASIPSTGVVMPRNRLEIKPTIGGRVETVLVNEGQHVTRGQILVWMSSTERAALLDAARFRGSGEYRYWERVYKQAPIVAPLYGFIIQRNVEPGQSVSVSDTILVMADQLVIKAQVDETDIGKISLGQKAEVVLDSYPDDVIKGKVEHIAYEAKIINNVTVYEVDVIPDDIPVFFRSGMSTTVKFINEEKLDVLLLPIRAVKKNNGRSYAFIKQKDEKDPKPIQIETGVESNENIEVVSGLDEDDVVIIPTAKLVQDTLSRRRRRGPMNPFSKNKKR